MIKFLLLVRWVLTLRHIAHAKPFNGLGENHRWLTDRLRRCVKGSKHFVRIVTAAVQTPDIVIAQARNHFEQLRMLAKEVFSDKFTVIGFVRLKLAIDGFFHDLAQNTLFITG